MKNKKLDCSLSVIIPMYNEEKNIDRCIISLYKFLKSNLLDFELILSENGSKDKTPEIVDKLSKKYKEIKALHLKEGNYGKSIINGFKNTKKEFVMYMDADGPVELTQIKDNIEKLKEYDAVLFMKRGKRESLTREIYSFVYNNLIRVLYLQPIRDINFSVKMFRKELIKKMDLGYGKSMWFIDVELVTESYRKKAKILWVPAEYIHRQAGASSINRKVILNLVRDVFTYRMHTLFKK